MEKEFGKLSLDQLRELIKLLPTVRQQMGELPVAFREAPSEKIAGILGDDFAWAELYELPFILTITLMFFAAGSVDQLKEWAGSPDPQQAALDAISNDDGPEWTGGVGGAFSKADLIGCLVALQRNFLSIMQYNQSLCGLVEQVRSDGNWRDPFFKAVRIDRSILSCETFAKRLAYAELIGDADFFRELASALSGLDQKRSPVYRDIRYLFYLLREVGAADLSDAQLEKLIVDELGLYSRVPGAAKNLGKQFREAKKYAIT